MNYQARAFLVASIALLPVLASCKKDFLSKNEKQFLFAVPASTELDAVFTNWQNRNLAPADYAIIQQADVLPGKLTLKIVSFKLGNSKEYGALLVPTTSTTVPVQIYVGGFGLDVTTNSVRLAVSNSGAGSDRILAIPALRGQSLEIIIDGTSYKSPVSEGVHCDAFDGATDDVLAFLNLVQQTEAHADVNRTGIRGGSRGCTVALMAGIRDPRIKRVVAVAGPTDMIDLTSKHVNDPTYQCQFLSSFKNGQSSLAETRNKMLAASPLYFAQHLPLTQLHMGLRDEKVPVAQGYNLEKKMQALGNTSSFELLTYDRTHEDIATDNTELAERIEDFFSQL